MKTIFLCTIILINAAYSQVEYTIMSYNLLNYPGNDSLVRNVYFRTVLLSVVPDVLVVQEITSQAGVDGFLNNVLNTALSGYGAGIFINGPDTDNAIFYKTTSFTFLSNNIITTELRNISEFVLKENSTGDTLRIYSLHLKAGTGTSNQQQRLGEVTLLRNVTDILSPNTDYIVCGDFNIYGSNEPAYQKLIDQTTGGYLIDIFDLSGTWNTESYATYHTQSPRVRQFGGGATGGMDDRFDMILYSQSLINSGGIYFVPGTFVNYGNDGNHYNDSINRPPNNVVSQQVADALHYSSDHIPVFVKLRFEQNTNTQITFDLINGWNQISVPLLAEDMTATTLFPTAVSAFYSYNSGYNLVTVLENGKGYWAKFSSNQSVTITGNIVSNNDIPVNDGWNLIGPFNNEVQVTDITTVPPDILASPFYGYNGGYYIGNILQPGRGYWIKTDQSGIIRLNSY